MTDKTQKVALPAYLPKRLEAFRVGNGAKQSYLLRDKLLGKTYDFEPWQFFVLEVLPGCEDFTKLASVFEDRFGYPIAQAQVTELLASVADSNLFNEDAASHPLLAPYSKKGYVEENGQPKVKSFRSALSEAGSTSPGESAKDPAATNHAGHAGNQIKPETGSTANTDGDLPAGIQDAIGLDPRAVKKMWVLFDPRPMLKLMAPVVAPLRYSIYLLPFLAVVAIFISIRYAYLVRADISRLHEFTTFAEHVVFSLFTVNLLVTLTTAFVAFNYRATVSAIGVGIYLGFLPRFVTQVSHVEQLARRERIWLHAAPILMRLALFSLSILVWYNTRDGNSLAPQISLALAIICAIDLLFASGNPLLKTNCYHLLSAFLDEPKLRGKSYKALFNKLHGSEYKEADNNLLAAFALASFTYMFVLIVVLMVIIGVALQNMQLGGSAIILVVALGTYLFRGTIRRFKKIAEAYERSVQFDRWRKRTLPAEATGESAGQPDPHSWSYYAKRAGVITLLVILFLPYPYQPGGQFHIFPDQQQVITTDVPGVIEQVYFDGGESVKKGTVIARLEYNDYQAQVNLYTAKMAEQQHIIDDLKSHPKPEEIEVAQRALEVEQTRAEYSKGKAERYEKLYNDKVVSFEDYDTAVREHQVDVDQAAEKLAALQLVKTGPTADEIAAAQAKWQSYKEERDSYADKIKRTVLSMPIDGNILTLHLKQKINNYLDKGQLFAAVENTTLVTAEIEVPEADIGYVKTSAQIHARPTSFNDEFFDGAVTTIDRNVTVQSFGNVIKVIALIENKDGKLKTGMTGYAKIDGPSMPVWKAFSLAIIRFINVQVWSWIP